MKYLDKIKNRFKDNKGNGVELNSLSIGDLVRPNQVKNFKEYIQVNDRFYKTVLVEGFPRSIDNRFISNLLKNNSEMDVSIRIQPFKQNNARRKVRRQLTKLEKDRRRKEKQGRISESIQNRLDDIKDLHERLDKGEERLFDISVNITTGAETRKELRENRERVESELNKQQLISGLPNYKMLQAFKSTLPTVENKIQRYVDTQPRSMPSGAAAELFPFAGNPESLDQQGVLLGSNLDTKQPVLADFFGSTNPNWVVMGTSGSGKSFTAKNLVKRYGVQGVETFVIDPHGEYTGTVQSLNGENIELSVKKGNMINPLDMMDYSFREKMDSLKEFYEILLDGLSSSQKTKLVKATRKTYREKGIVQGDEETWEDNDAPTLSNLYNTLETLKRNESDRAQRKSFQTVLDKLEPYVNGSKDFLDTQTTIETRENIVNFDIEYLPESIYPEMMYLILNFLHSRMKEGNQRRIVVIDEAWELLSQVAKKDSGKGQSFIFRTVKTSRKYNLSLGLVVQEINDLVNSRHGKSVLANTSNKIILRQDRSVADKVIKQFNLNRREGEIIKNAATGQGIYLKDQKHIPIQIKGREKQVQNSSSEYVDYTSQPAKPGINSKAVLEEELSAAQKESLEKLDEWQKTNTALFRGGFGKTCWVKTKGRNSVKHERLVYGYKKWLKEKFPYVDTTQNKADIELKTKNDALIGLEVETGKNIQHNINEFKDKVERNNELYDYWFTICINGEHKEKYEEYTDTVIRKQLKDKMKEVKNNY